MCVCVFTYIYIDIHSHIHKHIHTYLERDIDGWMDRRIDKYRCIHLLHIGDTICGGKEDHVSAMPSVITRIGPLACVRT